MRAYWAVCAGRDRIISRVVRQTVEGMEKGGIAMNQNENENEELRDLQTHQMGITDRHETRHTSSPVAVEPGRTPSPMPDEDDAR